MHRLFESAGHTAAYAKIRPTTPPEVAYKAVSFLKKINNSTAAEKFGRMVDVGCGSGQSTEVFAPYFHEITGIDASPNQIKEAKSQNSVKNIQYRVGLAEELPFENESIDLVSCGTAVHWFDFKMFVKECHRVLKPQGAMFLHSYHAITNMTPVNTKFIKSEDLEAMAQGTEARTKQFIKQFPHHPRVENIYNRYNKLNDMLQSETKVYEPKSCEMVRYWSLTEVAKLFMTYTGYQNVMAKDLERKKSGNLLTPDPVQEYLDDCKRLWGFKDMKNDDVDVKVTWDIFTISSSRPILKSK